MTPPLEEFTLLGLRLFKEEERWMNEDVAEVVAGKLPGPVMLQLVRTPGQKARTKADECRDELRSFAVPLVNVDCTSSLILSTFCASLPTAQAQWTSFAEASSVDISVKAVSNTLPVGQNAPQQPLQVAAKLAGPSQDID